MTMQRRTLADKIQMLRTSVRDLSQAQPGDAEEIRDQAVSAFEDVLEILEHLEAGLAQLN